MPNSALRVTAIVYVTSLDAIDWACIDSTGITDHGRIGQLPSILEKTEMLRAELSATMNIARDRCPKLQMFAQEWGRTLIPPSILADPPDVLVIIPHATLHTLPLHLVAADAGDSLCESAAVTYASSTAQFQACASRNPSRYHDAGGPLKQRTVRVIASDVLGASPEPYEMAARSITEHIQHVASVTMDDWQGARKTLKDELQAPLKDEPRARYRSHSDVLCILAHGFVDGRDHRASGILLSPDSVFTTWRPRNASGETFFFPDVPAQPFPAHLSPARPAARLSVAELEVDSYVTAELIALLGCSAGWGEVLRADEPASLAESLLHAGGATVISPMWDADLRAATDWICAFLRCWLGDGVPKAMAARNAYLCLREAGYSMAKRTTFVLKGDWL
jgi:CHAT domain-containing protein